MTHPQGLSAELAGQMAANDFRTENGLGVQPLGDLAAIIEQSMGVDVAILDASHDEHGLTMRDPMRGAVFVSAARTRQPMRQRSTLAHELAHVVFKDWHTGESLSDRSHQEIRADAFARHLLIPEEGIKQYFHARTVIRESDLSDLVQRYLVSPKMAVINLERTGHISKATKTEWMSLTTPLLASRHGWTEQYRSLQQDSDRARPPQRLLKRAISGYKAGVVSAQAIASLRGLTADEVQAELANAGITSQTGRDPILSASDLPDVSIDLSELYDEEPEDTKE